MMGRSPTDTKARLVQTATDLIWKSSYGSVSVDDICKAAGVKKGSFYYYFPSKADLAIAAMEEAYQNEAPEINSVLTGTDTAMERFERLSTLIYEKQKEACDKYGRVCGCPFASLGSEMAGNEESIREKADEIMRRQEQHLIVSLKEMVDCGEIPEDMDLAAKASEIHAFIMGQVMLARIQNNLTTLDGDLKSGLIRIINIK